MNNIQVRLNLEGIDDLFNTLTQFDHIKMTNGKTARLVIENMHALRRTSRIIRKHKLAFARSWIVNHTNVKWQEIDRNEQFTKEWEEESDSLDIPIELVAMNAKDLMEQKVPLAVLAGLSPILVGLDE